MADKKNDLTPAETTPADLEPVLSDEEQKQLKDKDFVLDPVFGVVPKDAETLLRLRREGKL